MDSAVIIGSVAIVGSIFALWWAVSGQRAAPVDLGAGEVDRPTDLRQLVLRQSVSDRSITPLLERVGQRLQRAAPKGRMDAMQRKIGRAGSPEGWTLERVVAMKVLLTLAFTVPFVLKLLAEPSAMVLLLLVVAGFLGFFLPNALLDSKGEARSETIRAEISNTIDQLAVMVRAGLGIDAAIARTARTGEGPLAEELTRVVQDMRVGVGRGVAMANLAERVDVAELRSFIGALAQAERLGVPIAKTLDLQASELRLKRRQFAEEQAMKLPVKILFPLVTCILPVLFIVLLGPAGIRIFTQLK